VVSNFVFNNVNGSRICRSLVMKIRRLFELE